MLHGSAIFNFFRWVSVSDPIVMQVPVSHPADIVPFSYSTSGYTAFWAGYVTARGRCERRGL